LLRLLVPPKCRAHWQRWNSNGLLLTEGNLAIEMRRTAMEFAVKNHLPTISDGIWTVNIDPYPLLTYGTRYTDFIRSAVYHHVGKILKGANPAEVPIQQPAKVELKVNLKTAAAIGITIPPTLLARADEVIE